MTADAGHRGVSGGRRWAVLPAISLLLAALVVLDGRTSVRGPAPVEPPGGPVVTEPGVVSTAWYCAEGTAAPGGRADETIVLANAGEREVEALVTVMRAPEPPVTREVAVAPRSRARLRVAEVVEAAEPGVMVEVFGAHVAVEHELVGAGDFATLPCRREASDQWHFAGGTTARGLRQFLALFNPFPSEAKVDVTFYTEAGVERPQATQGLDVLPRGRVSVPVHDLVLRREVVAATVVARTGRIVAERSILFPGPPDETGLAVAPGAPEPALTWTFPEGFVVEGITEDIWLFNPTEQDTEVEVQVLPDGEALVEPEQVALAARSALSVRLSDRVPAGVGHAVVVVAAGDVPVVAEQEIVSRPPAPRVGYDTMLGLTAPATRWLFPDGRADETRDEWIILFNPRRALLEQDPESPPAVVSSVTVLAQGQLLVPEGLGDLRVDADARLARRLGDALSREDVPLVVEADRPVYVVRALFQGGISFSGGIPFAE